VRVSGPDIPGFERRYRAIYPLLSPLVRVIWRRAAAVVAKCEREADMIHAVDESVKVSLIANGVDRATFRSGDTIPDDGPFRLLCVARLIERKGQHYLIEAVQRLTAEGLAVRLDLVGTGDMQAAYEAYACALGVKEQVRFIGYVPRETIAAHYAAAHVFILPSYNEGMSVATLEAMAAGLTIVVTRTGGTAELVEAGVNGLTFDWADVSLLTAHLRRLATNRALARRMGVASRARAASFAWDLAAERYLKLFETILTPAKPDAGE